jgi:zeta-carotene desaturase
VVSCSRSLVEKSKGEIVELAVRELREFFPGARQATLVKSTVIKEVHATYSPGPGIDRIRPKPETSWPRVFLAGDYVATGWPATMEGAVRSGYLAAEALAGASGQSEQSRQAKFLIPDLGSTGLMKLFG